VEKSHQAWGQGKDPKPSCLEDLQVVQGTRTRLEEHNPAMCHCLSKGKVEGNPSLNPPFHIPAPSSPSSKSLCKTSGSRALPCLGGGEGGRLGSFLVYKAVLTVATARDLRALI